MRLTDSLGNPIGYLPVTLNSGEESAPIVLKAMPEVLGERLRASNVPEAVIWGRLEGVGAYVNLATAPLDLSAYYGGFALVEIKIAASAEITGVRRIGQFLGVITDGAAGYLV